MSQNPSKFSMNSVSVGPRVVRFTSEDRKVADPLGTRISMISNFLLKRI